MEFWTRVRIVQDGKTYSIRRESGKSFELPTEHGTPALFYYHNAGEKNKPLYVVTLPELGLKVCEAGRLKDAKARTAEFLPFIMERCTTEDWIRQARSFRELCERAESLGVGIL